MKSSAAATILIAAAALLPSCGQSPAPGPAPSAAPASSGAEVGKGRRTTSWQIAVKNLDYGVEQAGRRALAAPGDVGMQATYVGMLRERMAHLGKVSDLDEIVEVGEAVVKAAPGDPKAHLVRATALGAAHRFADALAEIDEAEKLGERPENVRAKRGATLLALGRYEEALALLRAEREAYAKTSALAMEGIALAATGKTDEADRLFVEAEAKYRDPSPFTLTWIWFERASMFERDGRPDRARDLYRAILERLPVHAHAAGHLAQLVPPAEAEAILRPVLEVSDDPEYKAILALAKEQIAAGSGRALLDEARAGYDALMAKHPLAFADHAGWFYLEAAKDPGRAAEVAEKNLENRKTIEAYELALAALPRAGKKERACEVAGEAMKLGVPPKPLVEAAASAFDACGKAAEAAAARGAGPAPR